MQVGRLGQFDTSHCVRLAVLNLQPVLQGVAGFIPCGLCHSRELCVQYVVGMDQLNATMLALQD